MNHIWNRKKKNFFFRVVRTNMFIAHRSHTKWERERKLCRVLKRTLHLYVGVSLGNDECVNKRTETIFIFNEQMWSTLCLVLETNSFFFLWYEYIPQGIHHQFKRRKDKFKILLFFFCFVTQTVSWIDLWAWNAEFRLQEKTSHLIFRTHEKKFFFWKVELFFFKN